MDSKLKVFNVEFKIYLDNVSRDVKIIAYSPKQARKFFHDWWKRYNKDYAIITLVYDLDEDIAQKLLSKKNITIEEQFKKQQDYIYRGKSDEDKH